MTKKELEYIQKILMRTYPKDVHLEKALAYISKDIAQYNARKGQLTEQYKHDIRQDW
jgi:hypothetical protein